MADAAQEFQPVTPDELSEMSRAGFPDAEVNQFRVQSMQDMANNGFKKEEIEKYYGTQEPDMGSTKATIKNNLELAKGEMPIEAPKEAATFMEALEAGWDMSVSGLIMGKPDVVMPSDAPRASRIASQVATLAGDLPAMVAGWAGGATVAAPVFGAAGGVIGPAGAMGGIATGVAVGGAAGAFAAPAAMRKALMDHYEKGDIKDFGDFWDRSSAVMWEAVKQGSVGAATGGAGVVASKALGAMAPAIKGTGTVASEIATMVTVGKAIEGEMPNADDFIDAAILIGGLHAVAKVGKFRAVYEKTGLRPEQVAERAATEPLIKQDILSDNVIIPGEFSSAIEKPKAFPKKPEAPPIERSEAQAKVLDKVGVKGEKQRQGYTKEDFYKDFVDKLDPIKELEIQGVGKKESGLLPVEESPYKLARTVNDYKAKAKHIFEKGTIDLKTGETNGKGLAEIIEPHKADLNGLRAFIVAERAIEIEGSGRKSGINLDAAKQVVTEGKSEYANTAKELVEFQQRNLKYLLDSGRINKVEYDAMLAKGEKYIPFSRILEDIEAGGSGKGTVLKELKGSELAIQDPFLSILENTEKLMKTAETNKAMSKAVEFAEVNAPEAFQKVEVKDRALRKNEIEIWREGKREIYEGDANLIEALKSLEGSPPAQNILLKIMRGFTAVKRVGITLTPDFQIKNAIRDFLTSGVFSKTTKNPFSTAAESLVAMGDLWKKNDNYYNWLKSGGANGAFLELNASYLEKSVFKLDKQTGFMSQVHNAINTPYEAMIAMGNLIESAPRLAEFKRTYENTGNLIEGGFAAREITVDFQRVGAKVAAWNAITAFMNVGIQGLDRTVRAVKENPQDVAMKTAAYIVTPSILLWWAQHDDERYKEIPRWQKDLFWIVLTDSWETIKSEDELTGLPEHMMRETKEGMQVNRGRIYRIPKPNELGMVGSVVERVLEGFIGDNPNAGKEFGETIREMVVPSVIPDAITPVAEHATGVNFFTKRPLVPAYLEGQLPAYRYTEYTTETSKALGKLLGAIPIVQEQYGASPMVIENYVRGWTGTLGMYALQLADAGLIGAGVVEDPVKPAWTLADIPAVKSFVIRYPSAQAQSIQDFYEVSAHAEMVMNTLKGQLKKGDSDEVDFIMAEYDDKIKNLSGYKQALTKQSGFIHAVQRQKDWTPEEKRQLIETTYYQMIEISKRGLEMSREMEKALKEQ